MRNAGSWVSFVICHLSFVKNLWRLNWRTLNIEALNLRKMKNDNCLMFNKMTDAHRSTSYWLLVMFKKFAKS